MVARGQLDDATLYMCSKFPLCPTITRVQSTAQVRPAAPPMPERKPEPKEPPTKPQGKREVEPPKVVAHPVRPVAMPPLGMLVRNRLVGSRAEIRQAILLSEILGPSLATREYSSATLF
jgi:hypothetical protein